MGRGGGNNKNLIEAYTQGVIISLDNGKYHACFCQKNLAHFISEVSILVLKGFSHKMFNISFSFKTKLALF